VTTAEIPDAISGPHVKYLYRVPEAMAVLSLKRSTIYELIRSGRLRSVTEGTTRLIPASAIVDYVALLESEAAAPSSFQEAC